MFDDTYAKQKFYEAVSALIGPEPIQKRLRLAFVALSVLRASSGTNQHLPPNHETKFERLMEKLTGKLPPDSGEPYPPLEISDDEGGALAEEIFSIFVDVMGGL